MGIPAETQARLASHEGIDSVESLVDIDKSVFTDIASNLRKPGGTMPDPNNPDQQVPQTPFIISGMSLQKLQVASIAAGYYQTINREMTPSNMHYTNVLKDFYLQWKGLEEKKKEDEAKVPIVTKGLPITKWTDTFNDFCWKVIGSRNIPIAYVIRENAVVDPNPPPLAPGKSYSEVTGSVEAELVSRASFDHALYGSDNSKVYGFIEEAVRTSQYNASIKPYQRTKDGRGAYRALVAQHAGKDKWEKELRSQEDIVMNRTWKGNSSSFPLESYIQMHRQAYISMVQCSDHVEFQVPNPRTRVKHMIDNIDCTDPELLSLLALVKNDDILMSNFEEAAAMILPGCPVARKVKKRTGGLTAEVGALDTVLKSGTGKTGVDLRWHPKSEYKNLSDEQKLELKEWRQKKGKAKEDKKTPKKRTPKPSKFKAQISSMEKKFDDKLDKRFTELREQLMNPNAVAGATAAVGATTAEGAGDIAVGSVGQEGGGMKLTSILKRNHVQINEDAQISALNAKG